MRRAALAGLAVTALIAAGCSGDSAGTTVAAPATTAATATTAAPTTTAAPATTTTAAPETTVAETTTSTEATADNCVTCHTDEDTLRALAMEPEETEHLSEGEG